jgi:hypothetical protein
MSGRAINGNRLLSIKSSQRATHLFQIWMDGQGLLVPMARLRARTSALVLAAHLERGPGVERKNIIWKESLRMLWAGGGR